VADLWLEESRLYLEAKV